MEKLDEKLTFKVNKIMDNQLINHFSVHEFESVIEFLLEKKGLIGFFYNDYDTDYFAMEIRPNQYIFAPYDLAVDKRDFGRCYIN
ncbi:MAG: hypothetical protein KC589_01155 [Nanoarchaeota archaeon]|nr:hypothetical protein [Nanoarchaeota archaeon]